LGKKDGYGLRSDGKLLSSMNPSGVEWSFARSWGDVGDVVGCGLFADTGEIFFTNRDKYCGVAFRTQRKDRDLLPCITIGCNREVKANFGKEAFVFDIVELLQKRAVEKQTAIEKIPVSSSMVQLMVREYLLVHGYGRTLQAFDAACNLPAGAPPSASEEDHEGDNNCKSVDSNAATEPCEVPQRRKMSDSQSDGNNGYSNCSQDSHSDGESDMELEDSEEDGDEVKEEEEQYEPPARNLHETHTHGQRAISTSLSNLVSGFRRASAARQRILLQMQRRGVRHHERQHSTSPQDDVYVLSTDPPHISDGENPTEQAYAFRDVSMGTLLGKSLGNIGGSVLKEGECHEQKMRKSLELRSLVRALMKEGRYMEVVKVVREQQSNEDVGGGSTALETSPAWVYMQCLLFTQKVRELDDFGALRIASRELLPILLQIDDRRQTHSQKKNDVTTPAELESSISANGSNHFKKEISLVDHVNFADMDDCSDWNQTAEKMEIDPDGSCITVGTSAAKKRARESVPTSSSNGNSSCSSSHLAQALTDGSSSALDMMCSIDPRKFEVLHRLVSDAVVLLSLPPHSSDETERNRNMRARLDNLFNYFSSAEFVDMVADVINNHLLEQQGCTISPHVTSLQLCATHEKCLVAINSPPLSDRSGSTNSGVSTVYDMYPVQWPSDV